MPNNVTHFNSIFSYQHQQQCQRLRPFAENVCLKLRFPSRGLDRTQWFTFNSSAKESEERHRDIYTGDITCSDFSTVEAIKTRVLTSNDARVLLLCGFEQHGRIPRCQQVFIDILISQSKVLQRTSLDLSWSRRLWSLASRANMISFTGTYYAVLGGAYSSLSKADAKYAHKAGNLALQQIKLAQWLKNPVVETKCWLYYAEDLIQLHQFNRARKIIRKQLRFATQMQDKILLKMCESVQLKFDTEYKKTATNNLSHRVP